MKISHVASSGGFFASVSVVAAFHHRLPIHQTRHFSGDAQVLHQSTAVEYVDISPETGYRDINSFDQWAVACGAQKGEGFQMVPTSEDGQDFGVMTEYDMPANSVALFVPSSMVLSSNLALQEMGQSKEAEYLLKRTKEEDHKRHFYLMIKIMMEYEYGSQSAFFPWLNSLPRAFYGGSSMTQFCCSECLPPLVGKLANAERVRFSRFYQAIKHVTYLSDWAKQNRDLAKWAFFVVHTRSFDDPYGDLKIAPMADMFNHGTDYEVQLNYDEEGNCYAYTTRDVPAGSPLRMSYGDPTNPSHLFARYGFVDETSPATFCKIMIARPTQQLIDLGYDHSKMLFYKDTGAVSTEVWDVLLYQTLKDYPDLQEQLHQAHMNGDEDTKQMLHGQYGEYVTAALIEHVDNFLLQLDKLCNKAYERMQSPQAANHPRLPLIIKHNDFVRQTFLQVRATL